MRVRIAPAVTALVLTLAVCVTSYVLAATAPAGSAGGWRLAYGLNVDATLFYNLTSRSELVGAKLFNGNVLVYVRPLNATYVEVRAVFKGVVEGSGSVKVCDYSLRDCRSVPYREFPKLVNASPKEVRVSAKFIVDRRFNYAWLVLEGGGERFIGFFPYYIAPDITYSNASKHQLLYMGSRLSVVKAENGAPLPAHIELGSKTVYAVMFKNDLVKIYLIHHYPVIVNGFIPVPRGLGSNTTLGYGNCLALKAFYNAILRVNNYPAEATYVSWGRVAVLAVALGGAAIAIYSLLRRRR